MIEIIFRNGQRIYSDTRFSYTRQIGNIGDISSSTTSHTNSFTFPKNKDTTRILKGLGLSGDRSDIPYIRVQVNVNYKGVEVIRNGLFVVSETTNNYKGFVQDGNVDFWKAIETVTLAQIDLSESNHEKNFANVLDSVRNLDPNAKYKYMLADYGGECNLEEDPKSFRTDHLMPSIKVDYIIRQIFSFIGFDYNIPVSIPLWYSYPKSVDNIETELDEVPTSLFWRDVETNKTAQITSTNNNAQISFDRTQRSQQHWFNNTDLFGKITNLEDGYYRVRLSRSYGTVVYWLQDQRSEELYEVGFDVQIGINIDGVFYANPVNDIHNPDKSFELSSIRLSQYQNIGVEMNLPDDDYVRSHGYQGYDIYSISYIDISDLSLEVNKYTFANIDFGSALEKIKAKDFIKEVMHIYGLTLNYRNRLADFITIDQRLNSDIIDVSNKLISVDSEIYTYSNYAIKNILAHRYVNDDVGYNDGNVFVNNENLNAENVIITSTSFTPTRENVYPMFDKDVKENKDGSIFIEYKGLSDRSFILNETDRTETLDLYSKNESVDFVGEIVNAPFATSNDATFRDLTPRFYKNINRLLTNVRIYKITLDMSLTQMAQLKLNSRLHFENNNYLLNNIKYNDGKVVAEVIKID